MAKVVHVKAYTRRGPSNATLMAERKLESKAYDADVNLRAAKLSGKGVSAAQRKAQKADEKLKSIRKFMGR